MLWYLCQLFPMTYRSYYSVGGKKYFSVWKMFLGKVYQHDCIEIA